ncbi:MAG: hypothetical protein R3F02_16530 [Thiolinea sp.]
MKNDFQKKANSLKRALKHIAKKFKLDFTNEKIDSFGINITLKNQTTGVKCLFSPREGKGWIVEIGRLKDGNFPEHPIFIKKDTKIEFFNLRDIAILRIKYIPELEKNIKNGASFNSESIPYLLENCCADLLEGDFNIFKDLDFLIKNRVLSKEA